MATRKLKDEHVARWFAAFWSFAQNAPGPAQKNWATLCAGECLWALGVEEYDGIKAKQPDGPVIDIAGYPLPVKRTGRI